MHVSCIQAGMLLARMGRPEVTNCITGLEQYAYAYEECAEAAAEIKRIYHQALAGELESTTNSRATPTEAVASPTASSASNAMNVDQPMFGASF